MDRYQQCVVDHDHRGCSRNGQWVGDLHRCGEYRCRANGHDCDRRTDLYRQPGGRAADADLQLHARGEQRLSVRRRRHGIRERHSACRVRVDSGDQCVMDHDHRRWDQNGHWVGELYRCGEYGCGANGHDDHRRRDVHRQPGRATTATTTTELHLRDRSDERVNRCCGRGRDSDRGHGRWHVHVDRRQQCVVDHDHRGGRRNGYWVGELYRCGEYRCCANRHDDHRRPDVHRHPGRAATATTTELHLHDRADERVNRCCGWGRDDHGHGRWHVRVDRRQQCVVDHDHRRGDRTGSWVGELYRCGEYRCCANGHDDHRRPDVHRRPGGRTATTTELHLHDRADERVNRCCGRDRDSDRGHDRWHVRVDRRQQCVVDHDHPRGDRTGSWVGELYRCGEYRCCANGHDDHRWPDVHRQPGGRPPPPPSCTYTIAPTSESIGAAGGTGTAIAVTTGGTCAWTAVSNASWITITAGATGPGPGSVNFTVAANTGAARMGTMTIAGRTFTVTQAAAPPPPPSCTYTIAPTSESIGAAGGTGTAIAVTAGGTCAWTAVSNASWITITAGATGPGPGSVSFTVAANTGAARMGTMTIAGRTFTVTQAAAPPPPPSCTYTIAPTSESIGAAGGTGTAIAVTTGGTCAWTAVSNAPRGSRSPPGRPDPVLGR